MRMRTQIAYNCQIRIDKSIIVAGPSGSGKSVFLSNLLQRKNEFFSTEARNIYWFYGTIQQPTIPIANIIFKRGIPTEKDVKKFDNDIVILDDLMEESKSSLMTGLFSKVSHHSHTFVVMVTQNFFHLPRSLSLNAHYLVFLKNPRDKLQIQILSKQMYPANSHFLVKAFEDATHSRPFSHMFLDLCSDTPDEIRVRANIFDKFITVYVSKS